MSDEWNKGYFSTGPQRSQAARRGQFSRQQEQRRERGASTQAARDREQRFEDQMFRDAIWTASQPARMDGGRIFGNHRPRRGGTAAGLPAVLAVGALVMLFVFFGTGRETRTRLVKAVPAQHRLPPAEANPRPEPALADAPSAPAAAVPDRATAMPPMPSIDRFALRRFELVRGDNLELVASWQAPDGVRRAAVMSAFIVTRDAARRRTPVLAGWTVFPGESTIPLALPPGILPGRYELETVWTLGGEAREARTQFTLAERTVASNAGSTAPLPPAPEHAAVASVVSPAPPVVEPAPAPPAAPAVIPDLAPSAALELPRARPRTPAADPLYTGG